MPTVSNSDQQFFHIRDRLHNLAQGLAELTEACSITIVEDDRLAGWLVLQETNFPEDHYTTVSLATLVERTIQKLTLPFRVTVVGEFSRGKTTLINALLGSEILAADFRPNTAANTTIRYGLQPYIEIHYVDGQSSRVELADSSTILSLVAQYTSDAYNAEQVEGTLSSDEHSLANRVRNVHVVINNAFLAAYGIELVDTPGLGSIFEVHKSGAVNALADSDVVLFVFQLDPGIGEAEIKFLTSPKVVRCSERFIFVMTKKDTAESDLDLLDRLEFTKQVLTTKIGASDINVMAVSAANAIDGLREQSGLTELEQQLLRAMISNKGTQRLLQCLAEFRTYIFWLSQVLGSRQRRNNEQQVLIQDKLGRIDDEIIALDARCINIESNAKAVVEAVEQLSWQSLETIPAHFFSAATAHINSLSWTKLIRLRYISSDTVLLHHSFEQELRSSLQNIRSGFLEGISELLGDNSSLEILPVVLDHRQLESEIKIPSTAFITDYKSISSRLLTVLAHTALVALLIGAVVSILWMGIRSESFPSSVLVAASLGTFVATFIILIPNLFPKLIREGILQNLYAEDVYRELLEGTKTSETGDLTQHDSLRLRVKQVVQDWGRQVLEIHADELEKYKRHLLSELKKERRDLEAQAQENGRRQAETQELLQRANELLDELDTAGKQVHRLNEMK